MYNAMKSDYLKRQNPRSTKRNSQYKITSSRLIRRSNKNINSSSQAGKPVWNYENYKNKTLFSQKKRRNFKRKDIDARVVVLQNDRYFKGTALNISKSGIFVVTEQRILRDDDVVRLYIKIRESAKIYKILAVVARHSKIPDSPMGYGFKFMTPLPVALNK